MKLLNIINTLEDAFPTKDAIDWDFVGWQVKSKNHDISLKEVLVALDVSESVINQAIKDDIKLIISHHPFIFAKDISCLSKFQKSLYQKLIANDINVYILHTNFDKNPKGMAFLMAQELKLKKIKYFDSEKLSVVGHYNNLALSTIIKNTKKYFDCKKIKIITNNLKAKINNVVLAPGAGGNVVELLNRNDSKKISLIITGELKWHQELQARDKNISVLVVGHNMEEKFVEFISSYLNKQVKIKKYYFDKAIFK